MEEALGRGNHRIGPKTDETYAFAIVRVESHVTRIATVHLHGEADYLQQQHGQQHDEVSVAFEQCFHGRSVGSSVGSGQRNSEPERQRNRESRKRCSHACAGSRCCVFSRRRKRDSSPWSKWPPSVHCSLATVSVDLDFAQQAEIREHLAGPEHDRCQRIVGHGDGQAGFFADALVEVLDERAAAGKDDAAIGDVS